MNPGIYRDSVAFPGPKDMGKCSGIVDLLALNRHGLGRITGRCSPSRTGRDRKILPRCEAQIKPSWRIWRYHGARQTSPPAITLQLPEGKTSSFHRLPPLVSARGPTTGHVIAIRTQGKARALKAPLSRGDSDP